MLRLLHRQLLIVLFICLSCSASLAQSLQPFRFESTGNGGVHNVLVVPSTATFNSSAGVSLEADDELGVCTTEGLSGGASMWDGMQGTSKDVTACGAWTGKGGTSEKEGYRLEENIHYRLWKTATDKTYLLTNPLYQGAPYSQGQFNVNSSSLGMHILHGATIGIEVPTVRTTQPNISVCANEAFALGISVSGGTAPFSYQWYSRQPGAQSNLIDTSVYRPINGATAATFSIAGIAPATE